MNMTQKTRINIYEFFKNADYYIPNHEDKIHFKELLNSDSITGWLEILEVTELVPNETRDCLTGKIFYRTNWEEVLSSVNALKLPYLAHLEFYFEYQQEAN